jgi:IclR family acetate operon transcriptional repressor
VTAQATATSTRTASTRTASTRTVDRALDLLAEVCTREHSSLSECARSVSLAPSTALRLLRTLVAKGFVTRDEDGNFHSGPRLLQLGAAAFGRQSLVELAEPGLQRLVAGCGESAYLSVRGPGETAVYAAMVEGSFPIRHTGWIGRAVQLHGTAIGLAMRAEVGPLGFIAQRSELEPDVTAIAAPVRRPTDRATESVAAVISVIGPTYRIDAARRKYLGALVAAEAQALAGQLGGVGPVVPPSSQQSRRLANEEATA